MLSYWVNNAKFFVLGGVCSGQPGIQVSHYSEIDQLHFCMERLGLEMRDEFEEMIGYSLTHKNRYRDRYGFAVDELRDALAANYHELNGINITAIAHAVVDVIRRSMIEASGNFCAAPAHCADEYIRVMIRKAIKRQAIIDESEPLDFDLEDL